MPWPQGFPPFFAVARRGQLPYCCCGPSWPSPCVAGLFKRRVRSVSTVRDMIRKTRSALASVVLAVACAGQRPASTAPVAQWFAFHSNQWVNLHHFLYATARARERLDAGRPAVTRALSDTLGFGRLTTEQKAAWENAVD